MHYLLLVSLLHCSISATSLHKHDNNRNSRHRLPKRVHVAKKEDLLGEDTSKIDEAEYKLQSMISPETHNAGRFFNKPPSKEIGDLRVDTMSPAQVSFIQSSNQWHKYFRPSSPSQFRHNSNIYPEDPVLFPGTRQFKGNEHQGGSDAASDFLDGLGEVGKSRHHEQTNAWNSDSLESYGDTAAGFQHPKDYMNSPFTDKSWWNPKSEGASQQDSYSSYDGNSIAERMPKNDQEQDLPPDSALASPPTHFGGRPHGMLDSGGLGGMGGMGRPPGLSSEGLGEEPRQPGMGAEQRAGLLDKLEDLKSRFRLPQAEGDDRVFFGGHQKMSFGQSGITNQQMEPPTTKGLGTALAEELLQRNEARNQLLGNEDVQNTRESQGLMQGIREAATALRSGTNSFDEERFPSSPLFEENASQRANLYRADLDDDRGHVVLIRSHQVKDSPRRTSAKEHVTKNSSKKTFLKRKRHGKKHVHDNGLGQTKGAAKSQKEVVKKTILTHKKINCRPCNGYPPILRRMYFLKGMKRSLYN